MSLKTILIIEDEKDILSLISFNLQKAGFRTELAETGEAGLKVARSKEPDLIILDIMLPGVDGFEVCRSLKNDGNLNSIPILMLTARGEDSDVVTGLELGADDYLTKPFSTKVLVARVRAILRRTESRKTLETANRIQIHNLAIDIARHEVFCGDQPVDLSVTEFTILLFLAQNPGWVFSRNQIITAVKGEDYPVTERSVDVQILGLRKKLGTSGDLIETVRGIGYRLRDS